MRWMRALFVRIAGLFGTRRRERELAEEMESHLQMHIEDNLRTGVSAEEARRQALIMLGGVEQTKEIYRERRGLPALETLWQDLRFAARVMKKNPGFTAIAALTLALGIGANTAIFSIVNAVILRPLPYPDSSRMVTFFTKTAMFPAFSLGLTWPAFQEIRAQAGSLERTAAFWETDRTLTGVSQPAVLDITGVSDGFFEELGARAEQGRLLSDQDQRTEQDRVAVISNTLWRTRFARDPAMIGWQLVLDKQVYTVVGVAAKGFEFPEKTDVWVPLWLTPELERNPTFFRLRVVGKLRARATLETLQGELKTIVPRLAEQLAKEKPDLKGDYKISAETLLDNSVENARTGYLVLLAAATLVLLIACANLTSLLLARGWGRHRELALRAALGASPGRLQRQVLVESCLLALLGGAAGVALAAGGVQVFRAIAPAETPRLSEVSADWTLLWFALASSLLSGVVFGLAPARRAARMAPNELLKENAGAGIAGRSRFGNGLVVVEVALAFILLIGSTLMMQTLAHLLHQNPGFRADHLLAFDLPQPPDWDAKHPEGRAISQAARLKEALEEVRRLPGVEDVVASDHELLGGLIFSNAGVQLEGTLPEKATIREGLSGRYISPGYLRSLGIPLLRGREFEDRDTQSTQKVILVNEAMARESWGTLEVVGKRVSVSRDAKGHPEWNEVVGVAANARDVSIDEEPTPEYFLALFQWDVNSHHLIVRTKANPDLLADTISRQIWASNPDQPVTHVTTVTRTIADSVGDQRLHTALLGVFAGVGLALALMGVYGVVSYSVARRTQEIGVRMALGAGQADVLRMVLRQGLTLVALGAAIGSAGALAAVRVIASELYGVEPSDPWTFAGGIALLLVVGCLSCWIPARRAMRVDPMVALRYE
jgi:predicted permease